MHKSSYDPSELVYGSLFLKTTYTLGTQTLINYKSYAISVQVAAQGCSFSTEGKDDSRDIHGTHQTRTHQLHQGATPPWAALWAGEAKKDSLPTPGKYVLRKALQRAAPSSAH